MLKSEVMFLHLWKDSAYVEMDVSWCWNYKRLRNIKLRINQAIVLYFQRLFQIIKSWPKFLCPSIKTSIVVICHCLHPFVKSTHWLCFLQQLLAYLKILLLKMGHCKYVTKNTNLFTQIEYFFWRLLLNRTSQLQSVFIFLHSIIKLFALLKF